MLSSASIVFALASLSPTVSAHIAFWDKSMFGFNVTAETFSTDNRPVIPLMDMTFDQWWFHGHLDYPPHEGDYFDLPAGGTAMSQLSCDKGATSWFASSPGGDAGFGGDYPCPGQPLSQFHTTGIDDVTGCGLAIAYNPDARSVQPEDFAIFSVNHTCVWYLNTAFQVPAELPACPEGGCTCAFFWIHSPDSGAEQMYMNGFKCTVSNAHGTTPVGKPAVARRCGADPKNGIQEATPSNCTVGPKQPLYWDQKERNNMFEGIYSPPLYNDLYGFADGAQNDIFQAPTVNGVPVFPDDPNAGGAPVPRATSSSILAQPPTPTPSPESQSPAPTSPAPAPPAESATIAPVPGSSAPAPSESATIAPIPVSSSPAPAPPTPSNNGNVDVVQTTTPASAPSPSVSSAPAPEVTTSTTASAPSSTKKCKAKKRNNKRLITSETEFTARHEAIKRHQKRRLSENF